MMMAQIPNSMIITIIIVVIITMLNHENQTF